MLNNMCFIGYMQTDITWYITHVTNQLITWIYDCKTCCVSVFNINFRKYLYRVHLAIISYCNIQYLFCYDIWCYFICGSTLPSRSQKLHRLFQVLLHLQDVCWCGELRNACLCFTPHQRTSLAGLILESWSVFVCIYVWILVQVCAFTLAFFFSANS